MTRWLPFPLLWVLLVLMWLLLNRTVAIGHVLLGALIAFGACLAFLTLQGPQKLRRPYAAAKLAGLVLIDIVRSNIAVALIVLYPGRRQRVSDFVDIPLDLRSPAGLAALACILTSTPGTAWACYDATRGVLTMHVLDRVDENVWIRTVKDRYERRLLEIFE